MKWLGWLILALGALICIITYTFTNPFIPIIVAIWTASASYQFLQAGIHEEKKACIHIGVMGIVLTIVLFVIRQILNFTSEMINTTAPNVPGGEIINMYANLGWIPIVVIGAIFIITPIIITLLKRSTRVDEKKYRRNAILALFYQIITLNIYYIYWLWLLKKALKKDDIKTKSIWLILIPIVGAIILWIDYSYALEKKTGRKFYAWFLFFFFAGDLAIPINQALLNKDIDV